ncbi:MAG: dephospho-CoA kinase [Cyanobacteriota bacterium]|nr:dephospho-CoA kinase [Cyanobacteriota bacterium]
MSDRNLSSSQSPFRIGLTGGIATGKTTVSQYLARTYRFPVFDADLYAREAVQTDTAAWKAIVRRYGSTIINGDRALNRSQLGEIIFNNPDEKRWLEAQIHPFVRDRFRCELQATNEAIVVLAIPLLFESQMGDFVNSIWVVSCSQQQQLQRLIERDRHSPGQARSRIASQMPLSQKIAAADIVLDNSSTVEVLYEQIDRAVASLS